MGKTVLAIIGIILLVVGLIYAVAPSIVEKFNMGFGLDAKIQLYLGIGLAIIGLILIVLKFKR